jgi:predicted PurR-regulated permease PerM
MLSAVGLALYGIVTVILVDNILTSYFFGKGLEVSPIFVLFSILGGIFFFGPLGFILGPLVLSVFLSIVRVYDLVEHERITSS